MRGQTLDALLAAYVPADDAERAYVARMRRLLAEPEPFDRGSYVPGHFTASAFVLSPELDALLLIFHKKLGMWLQPGGHVEAGDPDLCAAAAREVNEEVGLADLEPLAGGSIFDVDVHAIPARNTEPAHEHFDVRFAFVAASRALVTSDEVADSRWVDLTQVAHANSDASVVRAARKLPALAVRGLFRVAAAAPRQQATSTAVALAAAAPLEASKNMPTDFDSWVTEHAPAEGTEHAVLYSEYIELARRFARKFDVEALHVAATYDVETTPGESRLALPVIVLEMARATVAVRWDVGAWPKPWVVSVQRAAPYRGPTLGLFDPARDLREAKLSGLEPAYSFPPHALSPARFTCELDDEWDVATLARLVAWED